MKHNSVKTSKEWDRMAEQHIESFYNLYPRYGVKIKQILEKYEANPMRILEVAAFSAKDSRYLASEFPDCQFYTVDLSQKAIDRTRKVNAEVGLKNLYTLRANAFTLPLKDESFDVSFHADFYVYFQNSDILRLFKEQKRVTKNLIVIFVHHKYNAYRLLFWYWAKIKKEPWYEIRAYSLKELKNMFADEEVVTSGGVDSYARNLVNTVGKGFIGRPLCPKFLRDIINKIELLRKPIFWEIIYIVIKVGNKEKPRNEAKEH
jgi:ubiquinone/menaquinone biosynthesis C-methylase UbiE